MIAFALFYRENSNTYRIDMLIISKFQIIISPDDGTRKMLHSSFGILDVNWYLLKILPHFLMLIYELSHFYLININVYSNNLRLFLILS